VPTLVLDFADNRAELVFAEAPAVPRKAVNHAAFQVLVDLLGLIVVTEDVGRQGKRQVAPTALFVEPEKPGSPAEPSRAPASCEPRPPVRCGNKYHEGILGKRTASPVVPGVPNVAETTRIAMPSRPYNPYLPIFGDPFFLRVSLAKVRL
jgi:hypothetical protein